VCPGERGAASAFTGADGAGAGAAVAASDEADGAADEAAAAVDVDANGRGLAEMGTNSDSSLWRIGV
jgi:hypothetical protein